MSLLGRLKGIRGPREGVAPVPPDELRSKLLALNHDDVPFSVTAGPGGKEGDVVALWKIVDAKWLEIFAKAGLEQTHRIYVALDVAHAEARILEESWEVSWSIGVPDMSLSAQGFRGRTIATKSFGKAYAFKGINPLDYGEVYNYRFDVAEMKEPIAEVVTASGWTYRPVLSKGKLAEG